ncbi:MAG: ATP-binding protein [Caldilineales bacterium]|nr:ATP-binding protein [Caldilineales bacterium]
MNTAEIVFASDLANLSAALDFVRAQCRFAGASDDETFACELATDEACTNIIEHAYQGRKDGEIRLTCLWADEVFIIRLHDRGQPFDPTAVAVPPRAARLEDVEIGGLGLHFMRSLMDEIRFEFDPAGGNTLTMVKRLSHGAAAPREPR